MESTDLSSPGELDMRTTLDQLDAELAILDRPLEDDVEYYDDPPAPRLWRRVGATLGAFMLLGGLAAFAVMRWSSPAIANEVGPSLAVADRAPPAHAPDLAPPGEPSDTPAGGDQTSLTSASPRQKHGPAAHAARHHHHHHHHAGR